MTKKKDTLPDNAFRPLEEGEQYTPLMEPQERPREVTIWSVTWGLVMAVIFSAAAAFLGLKVGQVFEAAIPITIIAVGLSSATRRKGALGENVIIQSIGACSGVIVAGAIFTLPALYILQAKYPEMTVNFMEVFLASLLGGILGILMLIPFRKFFVKEMHGKYPFPEATASTQILVSGEKGGDQAKPLLAAGLLGGLFDFAVATFGLWHENFTSRALLWGDVVAEKAKLVFKMNTSAAVLGMGYIVGFKYAAIICLGSVAVWWVIVPAIALCWPSLEIAEGLTAAAASPEELYRYAKSIGIGGIATAGIIGIIKSCGVIKSALGLAVGEFKKKKSAEEEEVLRTQRDISMKIVVIGIVVALVAVFIFFACGVVDNLWLALVGLLIVAIIAFLFTTVAANAIAIVGSNPVSGMTIMTLILASLILVACGLKGTAGMVAAMVIGGVVCTALSVAGAFITDLKVGYWIGTTPKNQETWKFLGVLVAAATVGGVMMVLNQTYGFTGENALVAPQANAMAAVIEPMMNGGNAPWLLYGIGAVLAIVLTLCKLPALAFALGMFIPIDLNLPLLIGGAISWFVSSRSKKAEVNAARQEKGTLIASGFIAGGALMGVVSAILKFAKVDWYIGSDTLWAQYWAEPVAILPYIALIGYMILASIKTEKK